MLLVHFKLLRNIAGAPEPQSSFTPKVKQALTPKQLRHFVKTLQLTHFHKKTHMEEEGSI